MDCTAGNGRAFPGGLLAFASGTASGGEKRSSAAQNPRKLDAVTNAGEVIRQQGWARSSVQRARTDWHTADEREPSYQRRTPQEGAAAARFPGVRQSHGQTGVVTV